MTDHQGQEWDRRHPDFEPGNSVALRHGAYSERLIAPGAEALKRELLADPDLPAYLRLPQFSHAVDAYCRVQWRCMQLDEYIGQLTFEETLTDRTELDETEERDGGSLVRHSVNKRLESAQEISRRWEALAANLRSKLGLDPAAAAKLGRNLAAAYDSAKHVMAVRAGWEAKDEAK
ncbi:MAG: hypothetical protein ACRDOU_05420 [Streptosporangiaceae bacterium]